jgi:hypothetical protein
LLRLLHANGRLLDQNSYYDPFSPAMMNLRITLASEKKEIERHTERVMLNPSKRTIQ